MVTGVMEAFFWISLAAASVCISEPIFAAQDAVAASFAQMKGLVGFWRQAEKAASPLRIRFSLTAGGTALVEE